MKTNQNNKITDQFLDLTHVAKLLQLKPNELQVLNLKYTNFDTRRKLLILKSEIEKSLPLLLSRYPENLEILVEGVPAADNSSGQLLKFLRRIPIDPITKSRNWSLRSYQDRTNTSAWGGENVFDIYTTSTATSLNGTAYKDW